MVELNDCAVSRLAELGPLVCSVVAWSIDDRLSRYVMYAAHLVLHAGVLHLCTCRCRAYRFSD